MNLQINMFITVAGEPTEIVKNTIKGALKAARFYKKHTNPDKEPRVIVLNDGKGAKKDNWKEIEAIARQLGAEHVARETNEGFKAGNINNGISVYPADDPHNTIDCFFDADFEAKEDFLVEILKPLADDNVDFVQSPQRYKNLKTWVAKAAGAHQIFFFDYICPAKAYDNALFLCGTNYAIRRKALLDAEGVENRFVTEDYATSIKLHLLGKKGVFVSKVLAEGYAPMNLKEYFNQQTRWCKGCLDANGAYLKQLLFGPLTLKQKFHYFLSTVYYFIGIRDLILVFAPLTFLFFGVSLVRANTNAYLVLLYAPYVIFNYVLFFKTFTHPLKSLVLDIVSFPVFAKAFISSVLGKNLPFTITIKKYQRENPFSIYKVQLAVLFVLLSGVVYSIFSQNHYNPYGKYINYFWTAYSSVFLAIGFFMVVRENVALNLSFDLKLPSFTSRISNFQLGLAKLSAVLILSFITGLGAPIIYDAYAIERQKVSTESIVKNTKDFIYPAREKNLLVPADGVYYGYYLPNLNKHPESPKIKVVQDESPTLTMYYQDWNENSGFNNPFMKKLSDKGVVPIITWEPYDNQNPDSPLNEHGAPQKLITSGEYNEHIREWAVSAKNYNKPFFLRFAHEMNGNWYAWSATGGAEPQDYIDMWRHVHSIFEEEAADNVIWVWSPNNTDEYGETLGVLDYYPGDKYVDWVGFSAFNWGAPEGTNKKWRTFNYITFDIYNELAKLNKPIMVAETSSATYGGDKTGWFYNTLSTDIPNLPLIKGVVIFNQDIPSGNFSLMGGMDYKDVIEENIISNNYYLKAPIYTFK